MTTKKKMVVSVSVIVAILLIAILATVTVFAATKSTVTNEVNISYTARSEVDSVISARYSTGYTASTTTNTWTEVGSVEFTGFEGDDTTQSLSSLAEITIPQDTKFVIFEFKFTNDHPSKAMNAAVTFAKGEADPENITMKILDAGTTAKTSLGLNDFTTGLTIGTASSDITVAANNSTGHYVYVLVTPTLHYEDSSFVGNFSWDLEAGA